MAKWFVTMFYRPGAGTGAQPVVTQTRTSIQCEPTTFFSTTLPTGPTMCRQRLPLNSVETTTGRLYRWSLIVWLMFGLVIFVIDSTEFDTGIRLFGIPSIVYYIIASLDHIVLQLSIIQNLISLFVLGTLVHCFMLVAIPSLIVDVLISLITYAYLLSTVILLLCYGVLHMRRIVFASMSARHMTIKVKSSETPRSLQSPYSTPLPEHNSLLQQQNYNTTSGDTAMTLETTLSAQPNFRSVIVDSSEMNSSSNNFNTTQC